MRLNRHGPPGRQGEEGNTLILYPFALLIVMALGGIALDTAVFFQAHRQTVDVAAGLASDMAGVIDEGVFATRGEVVIDAGRATTMLALANADLAGHPNDLRCTARIDPATRASVTVRCTGTAQAILMPTVGLLGRMELEGVSTASPR